MSVRDDVFGERAVFGDGWNRGSAPKSITWKTGRLTAEYETADALLHGPYTLRDVRPKFFNGAREITSDNGAVFFRLEGTLECLP